MQLPNPCTLCPRACRADRAHGQRGFCGADGTLRVARAALHHWEEPCLSGDPNAATGSGTVFFSNCALRCCYCQNYPISQGDVGKEITVERLTEIFLALQKSGAKNLNLVTATQYLPWALPALDAARAAGFALPVVYNTGGYETLETVKALAGYVDIWLADVKYASPDLAAELSAARDYPAVAEAALRQMLRQAGAPVYDADGYLQKGVIVRHLALPGHTDDTLRAVWLAAAGAALLCAVLIFAGRGHIRFARDPDRGAMWLCLLPVLAVTLYLLHTHVLHKVNGTLHTGQSCYGDMPMHLGFIEYIAQSGQFPPRYPLLAGAHRFGYPFLCETVSSVFRLLGAGRRAAYLLPMVPAFVSVYGMFWQLARRMLGSAGKACLAFYLFFMGSGFGFAYFLKDAATFKGIFTGFYTTPTNYTTKNIVWVNPIVDLLIPQRATLFGWCVLFAALYLLWRFAFEGGSHLWLPLAVLVLPLPLLQTHSALALVFLCLAGGLYTLTRRPRTAKNLLPWLGLAAVCGVCWLAEMSGTVLAQSLDGTNMLRLHFNWVNGNGDGTLKDPWLWFYVKNIGLVFLLILPAVHHAGTRQRWLFGGGAALWLLAEFVVFQPNNYDNNKLLFITHALGCMLAAQLLADWAKRLRTPALRAAVIAVCCFVGMFGSVLTVGRELVSDYQQWDASDIALADYISENAESDALFLTSDSHLTPVFALAGRRIVCGSSSWVYFHGMDYGAEYAAMQALYETPDEDTLQTWGVDYVVFDGSALTRFDTDEDWYAERFPVWYEDTGCKIYKTAAA